MKAEFAHVKAEFAHVHEGFAHVHAEIRGLKLDMKKEFMRINEKTDKQFEYLVHLIHDYYHENSQKILNVSQPVSICGEDVTSFGAYYGGMVFDITVNHPNCLGNISDS